MYNYTVINYQKSSFYHYRDFIASELLDYLNTRLSFKEHLLRAGLKASKVACALADMQI